MLEKLVAFVAVLLLLAGVAFAFHGAHPPAADAQTPPTSGPAPAAPQPGAPDPAPPGESPRSPDGGSLVDVLAPIFEKHKADHGGKESRHG